MASNIKFINKRLLIVFFLGFSSGLPLALLSSTLQAWFADLKMPLMVTGLLSLLGLPYVYRLLWSPLLDRYSLLPIGKRRSWILCMQLLLCIGFNALTWFSPLINPKLIIGISFLLACFSATQDAAIDAHRVEYLPVEQHGLGASLAVLGYRLGLLLAGGIALIVAQQFGWVIAYRFMGSLMLIGVLAICFSHEPSIKTEPTLLKDSFIEPVKELLSRPSIFLIFLFIFFYKLGEAFTATTSGIVMPFLIQGIGFSLDTIAYINKIIGVGAVILGGLVAGLCLLRWSLYRALLIFGLFQALANALFIVLAIVGKNTLIFMLAVIGDNFAAGMGSTAIVALFMRLVDRKFTATQFSILVAFSSLPRILSGPIAAYLQSVFGWVGLYEAAFLLSLGFIPFLAKIKVQTEVKSLKSEDDLSLTRQKTA